MVKQWLVLIGVLLFGVGLAAKEKTVVVQLDSIFVYDMDTSIAMARTKSLQAMRQNALEQSLPQDINLSSLINSISVEGQAKMDEFIATSVFMNSSSSGRIISEKVLKESSEIDLQKKMLHYHMQYRAEILPLKTAYNSSLNVDIRLSESVLKHNQAFSLQITPNQDGFLYIFDFYSDNSVALVFPNHQNKENYLPAQKTWEQNLMAVANEKQEISIETLYFVYSTEAISGWENFKSNVSQSELVFSAREESYTLFNNWLMKSDPEKRVEKMAQLHIYR